MQITHGLHLLQALHVFVVLLQKLKYHHWYITVLAGRPQFSQVEVLQENKKIVEFKHFKINFIMLYNV